jgi:hypothetical protein
VLTEVSEDAGEADGKHLAADPAQQPRHHEPARAARTGANADDPEPRITARALLGLWHVQADSLRKHLDGGYPPARLIEAGLRTFGQPETRA